MTEALFCEHKYRRDVETCPHCDLNETEAQLAAARAELKRLQESDPHRIAMVLQEALDEKREEWQERSRDGALALEEVCRQLDAARAEVEMLQKARDYWHYCWKSQSDENDRHLDDNTQLRQEINAARAEVEQLRKDNEQAWESRAHWCVEAGKAMQERNAARSEVAALHDLLRKVLAVLYSIGYAMTGNRKDSLVQRIEAELGER